MSLCDVSVVIPAYNAENFIVDALESIAKQTVLPKEVIVINDGSRNHTRKVIQDWISQSKMTFSVYLHSQENRGISAARNMGMKKSSGMWIAFLDADDIWENNHLEVLTDATRVLPSAIAAYGGGRLMANGEIQQRLYDDFWDNPSKK